MSVITIDHLTKDYGNGKGIFDLSFSVHQGEVFGFLGPNGAGKTTTIRQLMGFTHPNKGSCSINGLDCSLKSAQIQKQLGYLPGEIAFMEDMNGMQFIRLIAEMKGITDFSRANELIKFFELDPQGKLKKMSKGMKQKIGIVCAFMQNPDILILDEPTSGLDPLMQNKFVELILSEKEKGKTILMSSHMFEEVERTCDRVAIIKEGQLMAVEKVAALKASKHKTYTITFETDEMAAAFAAEWAAIETRTGNQVTASVQGDMTPFIRAMGNYKVLGLDVSAQTLEELFMHFYGGKDND